MGYTIKNLFIRLKNMSAYRCRRFVEGRVPLIYWVAFAFLPWSAMAQKDSVHIIKVKSPKQSVTILPENDILYIGLKHRFVIKNSLGLITKVTMEGASIIRNDSVWIVKANSDITFANMHIYGTNTRGVEALLVNKRYIVKSIPKPLIKVNDVVPDSVAEKLNLMAYGHLSANFDKHDIFRGGVTSFTMVVRRKDKFDTLHAKGAMFTTEMKRTVARLKAGSLIYFINIQYLITPMNQLLKADDIKIYMNDTPIKKFGG